MIYLTIDDVTGFQHEEFSTQEDCDDFLKERGLLSCNLLYHRPGIKVTIEPTINTIVIIRGTER